MKGRREKMIEEKIINKIVSRDVIKEIATYLENEKKHYQLLYDYDKQLNSCVNYSERRYIFDGSTNSSSYEIKYKSGEAIHKDDYNWFLSQLESSNLKNIDHIRIAFSTSFFYKKDSEDNSQFKSVHIYIHFYEKSLGYTFENKEMEDENHKYFSDITNILNSCPARYDKIIKSRSIIKQSLNFCIGFIFAYIITIILYLSRLSFPNNMQDIFGNKIILVLLFWSISSIFGNTIGYFINTNLFKNISPQRKCSHYSSSSKKLIYINDIEGYKKEVENQIGIFHNSIEKRMKIKKMLKVTLPIVLIHLMISIIICIL